MLDYNLQIKGAAILSLHAGHPIGSLGKPIIIPSRLQIAGFFVDSPLVPKKSTYILQANAIRELSQQGVVVNSLDDISPSTDLLRLKELLEIDFDPLTCRVITNSGTKLGQVTNYILDGFLAIQQLIVKPPLVKSFASQPLYIARSAITEIKGHTIIVDDTTKKLNTKRPPAKLDPNFVNPFTKTHAHRKVK